MLNNNIYILSGPIQTGKTTCLMEWQAGKKDVAGILTPDVDGNRMLYDIARGLYHKLQTPDIGEITGTINTHIISIGRFCFDAGAFQKARAILLDSLRQNPSWLLVDELGKLELEQNTGLEPALSQVIRFYQAQYHNKENNALPGNGSGRSGNLLLVIRDYLLQPAIYHYGLENALVIHDLKDI